MANRLSQQFFGTGLVPSQMDLWDYKPGLGEYFDQDTPPGVRGEQRLSTMTSGQKRFPVAPSKFRFEQKGQCGRWICTDLLPHTAGIVDDIALVKTVHTNAINHDPACTFVMTGSEIHGKASIGSWLTYGLGSESDDQPAFVVFTPLPDINPSKARFTQIWSSGFLPTWLTGVALRGSGSSTTRSAFFGGEFGRTVSSQGTLTQDNYGRDHRPRNFCMWMAGAGVKPGISYGETDDFSYNVVENPVHVNDFNATILHLMGIAHERFTFKFQGLDQRLTGVEPQRVVSEMLA